jgi:hypothetical protein
MCIAHQCPVPQEKAVARALTCIRHADPQGPAAPDARVDETSAMKLWLSRESMAVRLIAAARVSSACSLAKLFLLAS